MNGDGFTGYGPGWRRVRDSVEETVKQHLKGLDEPIRLTIRRSGCFSINVQMEDAERRKLLGGLFEKRMRYKDPAEHLKKKERIKKYAAFEANFPEYDAVKQMEKESLEYISGIFDEEGGDAERR